MSLADDARLQRIDDDPHGPVVSVGVPLFNGQPYLSAAIRSLQDQDYADIEIVVSDDGSTDGSADVVRDAALLDARIRLHRRNRRGERENFNYVLRQASGVYFMWAADHDLWERTYISSCVSALESDPGAVLAYSRSHLIDEDGRDLGPMDDALEIDAGRPIERYLRLIWRLDVCNAIYGVVRREAVARTGGYGPTIGPDHLVLAKLALLGTFIQVPEDLYRRRRNRPVESDEQQRARQLSDLDPFVMQPAEGLAPASIYRPLRDAHLRLVMRSRLSAIDKMRAVAGTFACFYSRFGVGSSWIVIFARLWSVVPRRLRHWLVGAPS